MATTRTNSSQPLEAETTTAIDAAVDIASRAAESVAGNIPDRSEDVAPVLDAVVAGQTVAAQAVESTSRAMLEGIERVRQEVVEFVSTRIRCDIETQQELLRCRNFDELRRIQARFVRTTMDQYTAETRRLMEIGAQAFRRSANG